MCIYVYTFTIVMVAVIKEVAVVAALVASKLVRKDRRGAYLVCSTQLRIVTD